MTMNLLNTGGLCPVEKYMRNGIEFKLFHHFPCGFLPVRLYGK